MRNAALICLALVACQKDPPAEQRPATAADETPAVETHVEYDASSHVESCRDPNDPELVREIAEADAFTDANYRAALDAQGLTFWAIGSDMPRGKSASPVERRPGEELSEREMRHLTPGGDYARDKKGRYYDIERAPHFVAIKSVAVCGCDPNMPGGMPRPKPLYYVPFDLDKIPHRRIEYDAKSVNRDYSGTHTNPGCDPPK